MRVRMKYLCGLMVICLPWMGPTVHAKEKAEVLEAPSAAQVVVRGKSSLAAAFEAAFRPAWANAKKPRPVVLLLDVTATSRKAADDIAEALRSLDGRGVTDWRMAALGKKPSARQRSALKLAKRVARTLKKKVTVRSTFEALTASVKRIRGKGAVVVYLADRHFEDDCELEAFITMLRAKEITFSAIGPEAAFGRGWNDSIRDPMEFADLKSTESFFHRPGVGRSPFGAQDHAAPWHGGAGSHPTIPWVWAWSFWSTEFHGSDFRSLDLDLDLHIEDMRARLRDMMGEPPATDADEELAPIEALAERLPADLAARLRTAITDDATKCEAEREVRHKAREEELEAEPPPEDEDFAEPRPPQSDKELARVYREFPLPSSFGPYGLMRSAGVTGGSYVIRSLATGGMKTVEYDYARCNLFPPDLRSRKTILASLRKDRWARAVLTTWHRLLAARGAIIEIGPPVEFGGSKPRTIEQVYGGLRLNVIWNDAAAYEEFRREVPKALKILKRGLEALDEALAGDATPPDTAGRRHQADCILFRHALRCTHFELREALAALPKLTPALWKKGKRPGILGLDWIKPGRRPHAISLSTDRVPADAEAATRIYLERRALLERFRGTPWGEQLALNGLELARPNWWEVIDLSEFRSTQRRSRSKNKKPKETAPVAPGGSSSGGGAPTTGK